MADTAHVSSQSSQRLSFKFGSQESENTLGIRLSSKSTVDDLHPSDITLDGTPSSFDNISNISRMDFQDLNDSTASFSASKYADGLSQNSLALDSSLTDHDSQRASQSLNLKNMDHGNQWRAILLMVLDVLTWKKSWYPFAIFAANSMVFLQLNNIDLSLLSILSILAFIVSALDLFLPVICSFLTPEQLSRDGNAELNQLCGLWGWLRGVLNVVGVQASVFRDQLPRAFSLLLAFVFLLSAWFSAKLNLLLLLYTFSTALLLTPGITTKGLTVPVALRQMITKKDKTM